jgi:hypothetical protein
MSRPIKFNMIVIFQSLRSDERQTGDQIAIDITNACHQVNIEPMAKVVNIYNRLDFFNRLRELQEAIPYGAMPFLHFEIHGSDEGDGLVLASGEIIFWSELKEPIRNINIQCGNNLFISMATCYGANLLDLYEGEFDKPCAFFGYVGAETSVGVQDVEISYTAFFHELILTSDIPKALIALLNSVPNNKEVYRFINCEIYRKYLIESYREQFGNLGAKIKFKNKLVKQALAMYPNSGKSKRQTRKELDRIVFSAYEDNYMKECEDIFLHKRKP